MALLYSGPVEAPLERDQLRSEHELEAADRTNLEMARLVSLVEGLVGAGKPYEGLFKVDAVYKAWWGVDPADPPVVPAVPPDDADSPERVVALKAAVSAFNTVVLTGLAQREPEVELAYQVGRSLRDTIQPPSLTTPSDAGPGNTPPPFTNTQRVTQSLDRNRIATIQQWLTTLAKQFPESAAKVVASSLGRWSDLAQVALVMRAPGALKNDTDTAKEGFATKMAASLLPQGDLWRVLLVGEETTTALLSPEGYVAAGDASLRRTTRIIGKVLIRYWWALAVLVLIVGVLIFASAKLLGSAGQIFTSIGTLATALGVTWKGIGAAIPKLATDAEKPIFGIAEVEAIAWSITNLPKAAVTYTGVKYLRQAGAAPQSPLGAF
jgi:hypothetical protein